MLQPLLRCTALRVILCGLALPSLHEDPEDATLGSVGAFSPTAFRHPAYDRAPGTLERQLGATVWRVADVGASGTA